MDSDSNTDAFAVILEKRFVNGVEVVTSLGMTEIIVDNNSPQFTKAIPITYKFHEKQILVIRVYDADEMQAVVTDTKLVGETQMDLVAVLRSGGVRVRTDL